MADDEHPFAGIPFLGDMASLLSGNQDSLWEGARQAANQLATGGKPEHNVDPIERHRLGEISRVAELHVANVTSLQVTACLEPVTRSGWATDALEAIRPLMNRLSERLSEDPPTDTGETGTGGPDPFASLLAMINPMTVAMTAGLMVGHLAASAFGSSDIFVPMPRALIVTPNIAEFAKEWSLDIDDVTLWVAIREHSMQAVLAQPDINSLLSTLLDRHIEGFHRRDMSFDDLEDLVSGAGHELHSDQLHQQIQRIFGNPALLLGIARDDQPKHGDQQYSQLEVLISVVSAYVEYVVAQAGPRLIGGFGALSEAVTRRQVASEGTAYADQLLGVKLSTEVSDQGHRFIAGVIERSGTDGLARLFERHGIPTPNEIVAPGLWLERTTISRGASGSAPG